MYARNYNGEGFSTAGRIPVQSFPEPGVYMGIERKAYEQRKNFAARPGVSEVGHEEAFEKNVKPDRKADKPNEAKTVAQVNFSSENKSEDDNASKNGEVGEKKEALMLSGDEEPQGLLKRLGKTVSKHSGGLLSEFSTEDFIILALAALFLLGAENDDGHEGERESLVPLVLAALLLF